MIGIELSISFHGPDEFNDTYLTRIVGAEARQYDVAGVQSLTG